MPRVPIAFEDITCDGIDDDCDGSIDEDLALATSCGQGACAATGLLTCQSGVLTDTCLPGAPSLNGDPCNGVDDDCDGLVDEDTGSQPVTCGVGACERFGEESCVNGFPVSTCEPGFPDAFDFTCDGVDDDCDGLVDEDC